MQNTLKARQEPTQSFVSLESSTADSGINKIEFRNGSFPFKDGAGYVLMAFVCCVFAGSAISPMFNGPHPLNFMIGAGLIAFVALTGLIWTLQHALRRYRFFQENAPKLTLTGHSLHDHRTGKQVNLADVAGIPFNQKHIKGSEGREEQAHEKETRRSAKERLAVCRRELSQA